MGTFVAAAGQDERLGTEGGILHNCQGAMFGAIGIALFELVFGRNRSAAAVQTTAAQ